MDGFVVAESPEVVAEVAGARITELGVLGKEFRDDRLERPRHIGNELYEWLRRIMHLLVGNADRVFAGERRLAADHLVHHDAKGVKVAARVGLRALRLFGREIGRRSHDRTDLGEVVLGWRIHRPGDAEVGHLYLSVGPDENVGGLDVAVCQTAIMSEPEGSSDFARNFCGLLCCELLVGLENVCERASLDLFHGDEVGAFELAPVVDVHDVGVR